MIEHGRAARGLDLVPPLLRFLGIWRHFRPPEYDRPISTMARLGKREAPLQPSPKMKAATPQPQKGRERHRGWTKSDPLFIETQSHPPLETGLRAAF